MNEDVQQRLTQAGERLNTSVASLGNFAASRLADIVESSVSLIERAVQNVTGQTTPSTTTNQSSTSKKSTGTTSRKRSTKSTRTRRSSRANAATTRKRGGPAPLSAEKQAKIREGFTRGLTTKKIAEFAGVSHSSAIRYTRHLRK